MSKLINLSLEELYSKPKITPGIEAAILQKDDFSKINPRYCEKICKLKCKNTDKVRLLSEEVDILVVQDHLNPPGRFDKFQNQQDKIQEGIISYLADKAGFQGLTWRLVSLLKCEASSSDFPNGTPPTQTVLQKCSPYLYEEIRKSKPKVIISLGTAATKSLGLPHCSNTGNRGEVRHTEYGRVIITMHPKILSYIRQNARGSGGMWGPDYFNVILRDFTKAAKIARGEWDPRPETLKEKVEGLLKDKIKIARSLEDVEAIMEELRILPSNSVVSFDTETTTVDPLSPTLKLLTIQFGWRDPKTKHIKAAVIPLWHRENKDYDASQAWPLIRKFLESPQPKVGHNSKFDVLVIYWATGVRVNNVVFDTLLLLHSIESGTQGCYGLKTACWDHLYELGIAGYEDNLGDLKKLQKEKEKEEKEEKEEKSNETN